LTLSAAQMSSSASTSSSSESARSPKPLKRKRLDSADVLDSEDDSESPDETPALSHAERRRQKKKEQQNLKSDSTPATKKRKLKDGLATALSVSKKEKRQNSVWVGNLSFRTTTDALRGFFDGVGEITRVHMPMKAGANGENMG
jgi:RNA recognition motif-containing protein